MKTMIQILTTFAIFISPIAGLGCTMIGAVLLDTLFAIYVTIRKEGIKSFRSGKLFNIVPKMFLYLGCILISYAFSVYIINGSLFGIDHLLPKTITTLFIYIEAKSIDETYVKMTGTSLGTILSSLLKSIKAFKKDINSISDGQDNERKD